MQDNPDTPEKLANRIRYHEGMQKHFEWMAKLERESAEAIKKLTCPEKEPPKVLVYKMERVTMPYQDSASAYSGEVQRFQLRAVPFWVKESALDHGCMKMLVCDYVVDVAECNVRGKYVSAEETARRNVAAANLGQELFRGFKS